jgi:chromate transporter
VPNSTKKDNSGASPSETPIPQAGGALRLFLLFSYIGLSSFGGAVPAWVHREFVLRREWIQESEFVSMLALARAVPGVNVVNLGVFAGSRLHGYKGAAAAVAGLLIGPSLVVIGMASLYGHFANVPAVAALLAGIGMASAGLLAAMAVDSLARTPGQPGRSQRRYSWPNLMAWLVFAATFALVGILRLPTVPVVLCLAPVSIALMRVPDSDSEIQNAGQ